MNNTPITEIAGYHLTERIGSGGMGDVYKAYNSALRRTAAVKILHQKDMAERFRNEAYIQSSVSHPNIACLYEYVVSGNTPCIIMEYVEGESLDSYLRKRGKLSNRETESIIRQVASALAYLHARDIFHRDVKPQNFKIRSDGTVMMLDFGIAKSKYTPKLTQLGFVVGTTEYMAPEQFQQRVEKKSDIWSLGVMAYELLTGYLPFEATNPVTLRSKIEKGSYTDPRIIIPQLSEKLKTIIDRSLRINPSGRATAAEIASMLDENKMQPGKEEMIKPGLFTGQGKRNLMIAAAVFFVLILVTVIAKNQGGSDVDPVKKDTLVKRDDISNNPGEERLTISVPNVTDAYIIFPDGTTKKLPYDIVGKEGERFEFTLQAEGYVPRKVEVPITNRRKSYNYNLEKINE